MYTSYAIQNRKELIMGQPEKYLKPTFTIDSNSRTIRAKADELTRNQNDVAGKAKTLFYFVRDQIKYTMYAQITREEYFKASKTLQKGEGYCVQKSCALDRFSQSC